MLISSTSTSSREILALVCVCVLDAPFQRAQGLAFRREHVPRVSLGPGLLG